MELTAVHKKECKLVDQSAWPIPVRMVLSLVGPYVVMACMYFLSEFYSALSAVCLVMDTTDGFASLPDFPNECR